jgi:hypothetical protein
MTYTCLLRATDWKQRRLRCMGHIINLIARQILFGDDPDAFETGVSMAQDPKVELLLWWRQGPVGKLHNIVIWISRSSQRVQRFLKLQTLYSVRFSLASRRRCHYTLEFKP